MASQPNRLPLPYLTPESRPQRPVSVLVLGTVGIVLGSIGLCGTMLFLAVQAVGPSETPLHRGTSSWRVALLVLWSVMNGWLVWACARSLGLRRGARGGMVIAAWAYVALLLATVVVNTCLAAAAIRAHASPGEPVLPRAVKSVLMELGPGFVYPALVIVYMRKRHVREAFDRVTARPAGAAA